MVCAPLWSSIVDVIVCVIVRSSAMRLKFGKKLDIAMHPNVRICHVELD